MKCIDTYQKSIEKHCFSLIFIEISGPEVANDLILDLKITLQEALLGFERAIQHLDGHLVHLQLPRGTVLRPGQAMVVEGEGMWLGFIALGVGSRV